MQVFGKVNTTPSLHGLHEISRHSVNFYKHQFSQHQMDLFIPYQVTQISVIEPVNQILPSSGNFLY